RRETPTCVDMRSRSWRGASRRRRISGSDRDCAAARAGHADVRARRIGKMIIPERPALERRVLATLDGSDNTARIPVVLGGCGSGRTSLLLRLRDLIGRTTTQYIDVERIATTPERFLRSMRDASPFPPVSYGQLDAAESGARGAFDATLTFLNTARAALDTPATFLLDEFLELRTFESFPGLRSVLRDLLSALASSGNRFVLTTRYAAR